MNDRFKFRAKRIDNNKFVYGYLCFIYIDNEKHCKIYSPDDAMSYDCYTETLGQCTGLKDRNTKLIYDNDIVYDKIDECYKLVYWDNRAYCWALRWNNVCREPLQNGSDLEVIGNIHENKELC